MTATTSTSIESVLEPAFEKWRDCQELEATTLLRLVVLREIVHLLHSEKSRCLASGKREEAQSLRVFEERLDALRDRPALEGDLKQLLMADPGPGEKSFSSGRRKRLVPNMLMTRMGREKFERYDRQWESAIAAEAAQAGWAFWSLETWVEITQVEPWAEMFSNRLWPHGVVLFAENAGDLSATERHWRGRWTIALAPQYRHPDELALQLERWVGSGSEPGLTPPKWNVILSGATKRS